MSDSNKQPASSKGILVVDDEIKALKYFHGAFSDHFSIFQASSATEALAVLASRESEIGVVVSDHRMPECSGLEFLKTVQRRHPETVRVLTTAYSDIDTLVGAINSGAVHCFVSKPWELGELERILWNSLDQHENQVRSHAWLEKKIDDLRQQILDDRAYDVGITAAKIGHYIHNALCPVTFLLDQLLDHTQNAPGYSPEFLRNVRAHVYDVSRTLKDLEQVSTPAQPAAYEPLDIENLLETALAETELIRHQKQLRFEKVTMNTLPPLIGVADHIKKLFRFMIAEEIVSLPSDSLVRARLSPHEVDNEVLGVKIDFEDFAPISSHISPKSLLHPFNLRGSNPREFGVFLVSCYFIARHHGGSLTARVKEDVGLCFSFFLPRDPREVSHLRSDVFEGFPFFGHIP